MNIDILTHKLRIMAFATLFIASFTTISQAATYYVSTNGSNTTGTGSQGAPWQTLSYASSKVSGFGDTIYINSGTYTDNSTANIKAGIKIIGAGSTLVTINTSASPYINAVSSLPSVDGSNEISGIYFVGTGTCIYSYARNNQSIHDCKFTNFDKAVHILGKSRIFNGTCATTPPTQSATYCDDDESLSVQPNSGDWVTGFLFYNNQIVNSKIYPWTIKDALIHDNTFDNSTTLKSAVGNTAYWWNNVKFYNNKLTMQTIAWSTIAIEVWMVENDCKFYNNWTNGWFSIVKNPKGPDLPYSFEIVNNTFSSNVPNGLGSATVGAALEATSFVNNCLIEGNYFENTGANKTYNKAISLHQKGWSTNYAIRNNIIYNMAKDAIAISTSNNYGPKFFANNINIYNNVIDTANNGLSQGVYIDASGPGTASNIFIKNNILKTVARGALTTGANVSGIQFQYNDVYGASGLTSGSGFTLVTNNNTDNPNIVASGNRPDPYYRPISAASNLVDKGIDVGLPYAGNAPDIGAYEYGLSLAPAPPKGIILTP